VLVGLVALGAGLAVAHVAGGRKPGDTVTGSLPQTTAGVLTDAANLGAGGKVAEALALYDKLLEKDPRNVEALAERGLLLVSSGVAVDRPVLFEQGRISIEAALRIKPNDPRSLFYLGLALRLAGETDGAAKALADALANNPPGALRTQILQFQASLAMDPGSATTTTMPAPASTTTPPR
jgi:tetratricopeptide (TPR) repeat protein